MTFFVTQSASVTLTSSLLKRLRVLNDNEQQLKAINTKFRLSRNNIPRISKLTEISNNNYTFTQEEKSELSTAERVKINKKHKDSFKCIGDYCQYFNNWKNLVAAPYYLQEYARRIQTMEEGKFKSKQKIRNYDTTIKQMPPIINNMKYHIMKKTILYERNRYLEAIKSSVKWSLFIFSIE